MLALDPPGNPTIGACIAANLSGPRRHRYGTARDLVIGVTVVLADGTIASSGGKVVKNVAGYDLGKLFCGSEGRLGLIARVALRLHPLPEATRTLAVPVALGRRTRRRRRRRSCARRSRRRRSTCSGPAGSRCSSRARGAGWRSRSRTRRRSSAGRRTGSVWAEARGAADAGRGGGCCSRRARWRRRSAGLDEAVVRVSAGVAYVPVSRRRPARPG